MRVAALAMVTRDEMIKACAVLRDELTESSDGDRAGGSPVSVPRIYPLALDVIATTPSLAAALAQKLNQ